MKWGILITIVLIAVLGGILLFMTGKNKTTTVMQENTSVTGTITPSAISPTRAVTGDTSDAALDKDSKDVSTKLDALNQDSANIDTGLNDVQGNLSEN